MITILDYGMGNSASILNMIKRVGGDAVISVDPRTIDRASALILPGVGSFDNAMEKLNASGLTDLIIERVVKQKIPFMGICLGMQLLFEFSEEGEKKGLGLIPGCVRRFSGDAFKDRRKKIPHMGWNLVTPSVNETMFTGIEQQSRFYFVHSYHAICEDSEDVAATCDYGYQFTCAVRRDNIFAVQFHPEKSHRFGLKLFENFIDSF